MPVDLPLLFRRVEQVRHVQVQTLGHTYALRRSLGPVLSTSYRPAAEAIAATTIAVTTEAAAASEAATAAARAAGWQPSDPGLARLRELLGEATSMRVESATAHSDQSSRLDALIAVQVHHVAALQQSGSALNAGLARVMAALAQRAEPPPLPLADLSTWLTQAVRASSLALDLSLLCESWLVRVHQAIRAPERATAYIPTVMRTRRQLRATLEVQRKQIAAASLELHAGGLPSCVVGASEAGLSLGGGGRSKRERDYSAGGVEPGGGDVAMYDGEEGDEVEPSPSPPAEDFAAGKAGALAAWGRRCALVATRTAMARQEAILCWLISSGLPEAVLQMLPEIPGLLADLDNADADADDGSDTIGHYEAAPSPDGEALDARRLRVLSISAASPPPLLSQTGPAPEFHRARLHAALALFSSGGAAAGGGGSTHRYVGGRRLDSEPPPTDRAASGDFGVQPGPHHGSHVALSAAEGGGMLEPYASPRIACFDLVADEMELTDDDPPHHAAACAPWHPGGRTVRPAWLRSAPCTLHVLWPRSAHAVRATRQALRELMRLQAAGCSGPLHLPRVRAVWCEPAPVGANEPAGGFADVSAGGALLGVPNGGVGRHLVCVHADAPSTERLSSALHSGAVLDVDELWWLLRGLSAALAALHALGMCCDGTLTPDNVAIEIDATTQRRSAVLCSVGSWPGASAGAAAESNPMDDEWAAAACEPAMHATMQVEQLLRQQPAAAFAADVWALGILIWRLRYPTDPPPMLDPGADGLVPPASQPPVSSSSGGSGASLSLALQRDAQLRECLAQMLRADPLERPASGEVLAHPLPPPSPPSLSSPRNVVSTHHVSMIQHELLRLRRLAASLPPARCTLDLANLPTQLLDFVGAMRPEDVFRRIEITLSDVSTGATGGSGGGGASSAHSLPLDHAISLFWRAALTDTSAVPLLHVPEPPLAPDSTPGLPPDAPLPPLDAVFEAEEMEGAAGGAASRGLQMQEALGRLLLLSLAHCVPLPSWLPPHLFKALLGRLETLDLADLHAARPRIACRCALVLASVVGPEFEWVDSEEPQMPLQPLVVPISADEMLTDAAGAADAFGPPSRDDAKMQVARRTLRWRLLGVRGRATAALARGFASSSPPSLSEILGSASCEALMLAGCAGRDLCASEVAACIEYEGWDNGEKTPAFFNEWLHSIDPLECRRFLLLVTGRVTPAAPQRIALGPAAADDKATRGPESGITITVRYSVAGVRLPSRPRALRASWELLLPAYNDAPALKQAMDAALRSLPEALV